MKCVHCMARFFLESQKPINIAKALANDAVTIFKGNSLCADCWRSALQLEKL